MTATLYRVQAKLLSAAVSTGTTGAWPCFVGYVPDLPDQMIGLQFTGGFPQDTHEGENLLETFQLFVRGGEQAHSTVYDKWKAAFDALENSDITDLRLIRAMASAPLSFSDARNRQCMTANFNVVRANA